MNILCSHFNISVTGVFGFDLLDWIKNPIYLRDSSIFRNNLTKLLI